ncbi:MAG: TetR/AcrR family transcriptional regulator [Flavobacteriaceae bacterium]
MSRKKEYIEEVVIEKAMRLFWRNGYKATSVRNLEKEMGINQFSIYSSFGDKQGVFLESIKCYKKQVTEQLLDKLNNSDEGVKSIKTYFNDFLEFSRSNKINRGCLLTNTIDEIGEDGDFKIINTINEFALKVRTAFIEKIKLNYKDEGQIIKKVNYLMVSLQGLSVASKMFNDQQLEDFIETTFENI